MVDDKNRDLATARARAAALDRIITREEKRREAQRLADRWGQRLVEAVEEAIDKHGCSQAEIAKTLGMKDRRQLWAVLRRLEVEAGRRPRDSKWRVRRSKRPETNVDDIPF